MKFVRKWEIENNQGQGSSNNANNNQNISVGMPCHDQCHLQTETNNNNNQGTASSNNKHNEENAEQNHAPTNNKAKNNETEKTEEHTDSSQKLKQDDHVTHVTALSKQYRVNKLEIIDIKERLPYYQIRRYQNIFDRIIYKLAEDLSGYKIEGDDEYDMEKILQRRLDHKPLSKCTSSREKENIIILLDTSGSCVEQAMLYTTVIELALKHGGIELYTAPNGYITTKIKRNKMESVSFGSNWPWRGRHIIIFTDFDALHALIPHSHINTIYWFSSETRFKEAYEHPWYQGGNISISDFKGKLYPNIVDIKSFINTAKKLRV